MPDSRSGDKTQSRSAALAVAGGIFTSRVIGFVRDRALAHYLGNSSEAGAYRAALRIPNALQNLCGEGALSASFIPVYARLIAEGKHEEARRVASAVFGALALLLTVLAALGATFAEQLTDLFAGGFDGDVRALTVRLVRIMFPGAAALALSAWCLGVLNSHRRFFLSYVSPIMWSLAIIASLVASARGAPDVNQEEKLVLWAAWGTVVGAALQFLVQLPAALRLNGGLAMSFTGVGGHVRRIGTNFLPAVMSRGVVQISAYVDQYLASVLGPSVVSAMYNATTINTLPFSLFGIAVSASELSSMSGLTGDTEALNKSLRERQSSAHRRIAFYIVPSMIAFIVLGDLVVSTLLQTGRFEAKDVKDVWMILAASSIGLLAGTQGRLCASGLWVLGDTRTPFRFATLRVVVAAMIGVVVTLVLPERLGWAPMKAAAALAAASALAGWLECLLVRRALRKRIGAFSIQVGWTLRLGGVALCAAGVTVALASVVPAFAPWLRGPALMSVFGGCYVAAAYALRSPEALELVGAVRRRLPGAR